MRVSLLGALLSASVIVAACFTDRPSEDLACSINADCDTRFPGENRRCDSGYCVVQNCPADCTSCDETAQTCMVDCTSTKSCAGTITCPSGWSCTISCVGGDACNDISCETQSTCNITCSGTNACGDVQCASACKCDLACTGSACGVMSCPTVGNGANQVRCTADGSSDTECDSAHAPGCTKC